MSPKMDMWSSMCSQKFCLMCMAVVFFLIAMTLQVWVADCNNKDCNQKDLVDAYKAFMTLSGIFAVVCLTMFLYKWVY